MSIKVGIETKNVRKELVIKGKKIAYYSIEAASNAGLGDFSKLPAALNVVLENLLRFEDGKTVDIEDIEAFSDWAKNGGITSREIAYPPPRVQNQHITPQPAVDQ